MLAFPIHLFLIAFRYDGSDKNNGMQNLGDYEQLILKHTPSHVLSDVRNAMAAQAPAALPKLPESQRHHVLAIKHNLAPANCPEQALKQHRVVFYRAHNQLYAATDQTETVSIFNIARYYFEDAPIITPLPEQEIDWLLQNLKVAPLLELLEQAQQWLTGAPKIASPVLAVLQWIWEKAVLFRAADIHFEPQQHFIELRLRIEGELRTIARFAANLWPYLVRAIKTLADLDTTQKRLPQQGSFAPAGLPHNVDCRVSLHPTEQGESVVIRVLNQQHQLVTLEALGFPHHILTPLKKIKQRAQGLIVLTGPTGSGKTTTLYSIIHHLHAPTKNIMTLEDPVEYQMPHVRQTSVQPDIGFTYEEGIKSILRQDPDVILIGEIRDAQTAHMAVRAALTGHLVLTTLHAGSVFGVVSRLIDFGVSPRLVADVLKLILSQRLVGRPRKAVGEVLQIDEAIATLIEKESSIATLKKAAKEQGYVSIDEQTHVG